VGKALLQLVFPIRKPLLDLNLPTQHGSGHGAWKWMSSDLQPSFHALEFCTCPLHTLLLLDIRRQVTSYINFHPPIQSSAMQFPE
jgi:hypothetical protein